MGDMSLQEVKRDPRGTKKTQVMITTDVHIRD